MDHTDTDLIFERYINTQQLITEKEFDMSGFSDDAPAVKTSGMDFSDKPKKSGGISATLKPIMNKMKKLNIGLPYRDARLFFFNFIRDNYPDLVPEEFETRKPAAKDVNALVGRIAMEDPDTLDKMSAEFNTWAEEAGETGVDRVSEFLNTASIIRQGKSVRPKGGEGYVKKDFTGITRDDIIAATTDAVEEVKVDGDDTIGDENLLLKSALSRVFTIMGHDDDLDPEVIANAAEASAKVGSIKQFRELLRYMKQYEEYTEVVSHLEEVADIVETNLGDMGVEVEDEESTSRYNTPEKESSKPRTTLKMPSHLSPITMSPANCHSQDDDEDEDEEGELDERQEPHVCVVVAEDGEHPKEFPTKAEAEEWAREYVPNYPEETHSDHGQQVYVEPSAVYHGSKEELKDEGGTEKWMTGLDDTPAPEEAEEVKMSPQAMTQHMISQYKERIQHRTSQERLNHHGY